MSSYKDRKNRSKVNFAPMWRRWRDLNPRAGFLRRPPGFQDRTLQPLGYISNYVHSNHHLSKVTKKKERNDGEKSPVFCFLRFPKALENTRFFGGRLPKWRFGFKTGRPRPNCRILTEDSTGWRQQKKSAFSRPYGDERPQSRVNTRVAGFPNPGAYLRFF